MSCHQSLERFLGRQIKVLNHAFGRRIREESSARGLDELTIMHGRILGYLKHNQDRDVFQKDIEEAFNITRSSVTGVVKLMEQKGYIRRESVAGDARLKKLCLTELGDQVCERSFQVFLDVEALAMQGFTPDEIDTFFSLCQRIRANLNSPKEGPHGKNHPIPGQGV